MSVITASTLYDYIRCPHRVWRDKYGPQDEKDKDVNPFVKLLWEKGIQHEEKIVKTLGAYIDLRQGTIEERIARTTTALQSGENLLYQPVIRAGDLLGIPDLLQKCSDGTYKPIDIKSGVALEGDEDDEAPGKPKKHYAVQLCLYVDILKQNGFQKSKTADIIDIGADVVTYKLDESIGPRTPMSWWQLYLQTKKEVQLQLRNSEGNQPAMCGVCKLCPWYSSCTKWCRETDDMTTIFYVGRKVRDTLSRELDISSALEVEGLDVETLVKRKEKDKDYLKGLGETSLTTMVRRAHVLKTRKSPVVYSKKSFPEVSTELFFDIEDDPTQDFVYLHGVLERNNGKERYLSFVAPTNSAEDEQKAWSDFWRYIKSLKANNFTVYYYSHHEKTTYKRLFNKYPDIIEADYLESFFENSNVIDLYKFVSKNTDWPTWNYSLKTLATYLGFHWRDETPSGALSIEWFSRYLESKDPKILERILQYNEDDCRATLVLKDALEKMIKGTVIAK